MGVSGLGPKSARLRVASNGSRLSGLMLLNGRAAVEFLLCCWRAREFLRQGWVAGPRLTHENLQEFLLSRAAQRTHASASAFVTLAHNANRGQVHKKGMMMMMLQAEPRLSSSRRQASGPGTGDAVRAVHAFRLQRKRGSCAAAVERLCTHSRIRHRCGERCLITALLVHRPQSALPPSHWGLAGPQVGGQLQPLTTHEPGWAAHAPDAASITQHNHNVPSMYISTNGQLPAPPCSACIGTQPAVCDVAHVLSAIICG